MRARELRASILQLAVEGRLVEQRPEEGTAAGLLEEVRAERAALVAAGRAKPPKGGESVIERGGDRRFYERRVDAKGRAGEPVCIDDEIPFEIPGSWEWARLGSITSVISDGDHQAPPQTAKGVPFLVISDVSNGAISFANTRHVPAAYYECIADDRKPLQGDLLFTVTGSFGITVPVNTDEPFCFQRHIALIRPLVWRPFLDYVLTAPSAYSYFKHVATGTAQKTVSLTNLRNTLIPVPPLAEQERIVAKIDELMPLVEEYGRLEERRERLDAELPGRLRKGVLQMAVEGRLVEQRPEEGTAAELLEEIRAERAALVAAGGAKLPKGGESVISRGEDGRFYERRVDAKGRAGEPVCIDDELPFEIPGSWEWARLECMATYIQRGKSPRYSLIKKYPVVAQKCNQWSGFSIEKAQFIDPATVSGYADERLLRDGDLLWNSTGLGSLGRLAIYDSAANPYGWAVADSHVTVIRLDSKRLLHRFAFYYFAGPSIQNVIEDKASGSTKQKELGLETVRKYLIPAPPLAEQERIVAKVDELLALIDGLTA